MLPDTMVYVTCRCGERDAHHQDARCRMQDAGCKVKGGGIVNVRSAVQIPQMSSLRLLARVRLSPTGHLRALCEVRATRGDIGERCGGVGAERSADGVGGTQEKREGARG